MKSPKGFRGKYFSLAAILALNTTIALASDGQGVVDTQEQLQRKSENATSEEETLASELSAPVMVVSKKIKVSEVGAPFASEVYSKKEIQKSPDYEIEKDGKYKYLLKSINIGFSSFLHNTYIQTLVQFGILGFIIWLNMFYQIIKIEKSVNLHKKLTNYIVIMYLLICIAGAELMYQNLGKMLLLIFSLLIYNKNDKILNTN